MKFVRENVLDVLNRNKAVIGSKGYFSDRLSDLKMLVEEDEKKGCWYGLLERTTYDEDYMYAKNNGENFSFFYPVEFPTEKNYRPFESVLELKTVFCEKFYEEELGASNPFIWVREKNTKIEYLITGYNPALRNVHTDIKIFSLENLFFEYTFLDGSPCGEID